MTNTEQQTGTSTTGAGVVDGVPAGYTALTPYLCVDGGDAAIRFYTTAFGATVVSRMDGPDGTVAHAELDFGNGRLQLSDPVPDMGLAAPAGGGATHSLVHYCADVDATWRRAVDAGATPSNEPDTFVTGDRFGAVLDPFGHRWTIMTRVEDVPPEEAERRVKEWLATQD
jgi:PhnB protein